MGRGRGARRAAKPHRGGRILISTKGLPCSVSANSGWRSPTRLTLLAHKLGLAQSLLLPPSTPPSAFLSSACHRLRVCTVRHFPGLARLRKPTLTTTW